MFEGCPWCEGRIIEEYRGVTLISEGELVRLFALWLRGSWGASSVSAARLLVDGLVDLGEVEARRLAVELGALKPTSRCERRASSAAARKPFRCSTVH